MPDSPALPTGAASPLPPGKVTPQGNLQTPTIMPRATPLNPSLQVPGSLSDPSNHDS